jgi:Right handed beta helix region
VTGVLLGQVTNGSVFIEHCVISGFGIGIRAHTVDSAARLGVIDSVIRDNHTGLTMDFSGADQNGAYATRTRFEGNFIGVKTAGTLPFVAKECVAADNATGFFADGSGRLVITNSLVTRNGSGIEATGAGHIFLASSTISGNNQGLSSQIVVHTMGNNMITENEIDFSAPAFVILAGI